MRNAELGERANERCENAEGNILEIPLRPTLVCVPYRGMKSPGQPHQGSPYARTPYLVDKGKVGARHSVQCVLVCMVPGRRVPFQIGPGCWMARLLASTQFATIDALCSRMLRRRPQFHVYFREEHLM